MSFFTKSTGETLNKTNVTGSFESSTDMQPIPDKTVTKAVCTEAKWAMIDKLPDGESKRYVGERYINIRWDVVDGEHKGRVTFQKLWVTSNDDAVRDKAIDMLAAIDMNATGGKLIAAGKEPSDMDLMSNLSQKIMFVRQRVWGKTGEKQGNWIDAVNSAKKQQRPSASTAEIVVPQCAAISDDDEELGF